MKSTIIFIAICLTAANAAQYSYVWQQDWENLTNCSGMAEHSTAYRLGVCIQYLPGISSLFSCDSDGAPMYQSYISGDCTGENTVGTFNESCQGIDWSSKFSCIEDLESIPKDFFGIDYYSGSKCDDNNFLYRTVSSSKKCSQNDGSSSSLNCKNGDLYETVCSDNECSENCKTSKKDMKCSDDGNGFFQYVC